MTRWPYQLDMPPRRPWPQRIVTRYSPTSLLVGMVIVAAIIVALVIALVTAKHEKRAIKDEAMVRECRWAIINWNTANPRYIIPADTPDPCRQAKLVGARP